VGGCGGVRPGSQPGGKHELQVAVGPSCGSFLLFIKSLVKLDSSRSSVFSPKVPSLPSPAQYLTG
jgi:hypothetical protein